MGYFFEAEFLEQGTTSILRGWSMKEMLCIWHITASENADTHKLSHDDQLRQLTPRVPCVDRAPRSPAQSDAATHP